MFESGKYAPKIKVRQHYFRSSLLTLKQSFFRLFGELYIESFDTGEEDFDGKKTCLTNITLEKTNSLNTTFHSYTELEGRSRCPNLTDKSADQFLFRIALYLVLFGINVILINILIGQISNTLNRVMQKNDNEYYLNALDLKAGFFK